MTQRVSSRDTSDGRPVPGVSVIIPTHNRAAVLSRSVTSVLKQTLPVLEVLVVDDGSTDDTRTVVKCIMQDDVRVKYVWQENAGAPAARNRGISLARGELIAFQDSDDEWAPEFLETLYAEMGDPNRVVFSSFRLIQLDGRSEIRPKARLSNPKRQLLRENVISTQTALIYRSLLGPTSFDVRLPRLQDWDLWLSLFDRASFVHVPVPLVHLHVQADSLSENAPAYFRALRIVLRKHFWTLARSPLGLARNMAKAAIGRPLRTGRTRTARSASHQASDDA